jgi:hypothetical protein
MSDERVRIDRQCTCDLDRIGELQTKQTAHPGRTLGDGRVHVDHLPGFENAIPRASTSSPDPTYLTAVVYVRHDSAPNGSSFSSARASRQEG